MAGAALAAVPAMAAERGYMVTDFDRIRVEGPYAVIVETGKSSSARATGTAEAIERVSISVQSRTLVVRVLQSGWGGWPGADHAPSSIRVTVPRLMAASLRGSGSLSISQMRGARLDLAVSGAGTLTVRDVETDQLGIDLQGSGGISIVGKALAATISTSGSGSLVAPTFFVRDLKLFTQSSGRTDVGAARSAKIAASGSGTVTIIGSPACTVTAIGSGTVSCGKNAR
jgi:hypothetical protein